MTPFKAALYKTAQVAGEIPGFTRGQFVAVRYLGIGADDEPMFAIAARTGGVETLVEASKLERFVL